MGVIKVLNSKSDLQAHSRALAIVSYDRPHTIFYYYPIATISLSCTVSQILQNLKRSRDSEHIPLVSKYHAMSTLVFICINQYMKFEVPIYSFTNYKDMIGAKFKKTVLVTLTTPLLGVICHHRLGFGSVYLHAKFYDFSFSRSRDTVGAHQNLNGLPDLTTPLSGIVCNSRVG